MKLVKAAVAVITALTFIINSAPRSYASGDFYVKVLSANVNIRSGPGTQYDVVARTGKAGSFTYTGAQFDEFDILWYRIEGKKGFTGWISSNYSRRYMLKDTIPEIDDPEPFVSDGTAYNDISEVVSKTFIDTNAVAVQVAAIRGSDGKIFDWTYGWSKYGEKKLGNATKFRAASISKVAVALCALKMQEEGIVDINKRIDKIWGSTLPMPVSLATLLTHSSNLLYLSFKASKEEILDQLTKSGSYKKGKAGSAALWSYNNYGSSVAATTLELAADTVLEDYAQENLFGPLGLDMSFFSGKIEKTSRLATLYDADYSVELTPSEAKNVLPDGIIGANSGNYIGGMTGSARDTAKMFYMLANDGKYGKTQILSPESIEMLEKRYFTATEYGGKFKQALTLRYGKNRYGTNGVYYHTGNAYGVIALASYDPETKNTVVVFTTGASHDRDDDGVYKVCSDITDAVYRNIDLI